MIRVAALACAVTSAAAMTTVSPPTRPDAPPRCSPVRWTGPRGPGEMDFVARATADSAGGVPGTYGRVAMGRVPTGDVPLPAEVHGQIWDVEAFARPEPSLRGVERVVVVPWATA